VEYAIADGGTTLTRRFVGSRETFDSILSAGRFPTPPSGTSADRQVLATNLLPDNADAARGLGAFYNEAPRQKFVILTGDELLPNPPSATNPPKAIEVNLAVTDPDSATTESLALLSDPNYRLRDAGLYSFRIALPPPSTP
jgi:hypothetical protein